MAKDYIVIIDYGSGNLRSAAKAFERVISEAGLNLDVRISTLPEDVLKASRIILPGQGAFGDCMEGLCALDGMREALEEAVIKRATPFLGICVGMQLMATRGLEHGSHAGLNWIPGEVIPMDLGDKSLKIPHMGWNELVMGDLSEQDNRHFVLRSVESLKNYYFVHSYMFQYKEGHHVLAMCDYGGLFPAVIGRDNMIGMQFHPEKSHNEGLQLLLDFLLWKP